MKQLNPFKRPDRDFYYCQFMYRGKRYSRCLETEDKKLARQFAAARYEEITTALIRGDDKALEATKLRTAAEGLMAPVFTAYATAPVKAKPKARRNNAGTLRLLLAECGLGADAGNLRRSAINDALARTWWAKAKARMDAAPDQLAAQTAYATAESKFNQANSLFAAAALDWYRQHDCYSDTFERFSKTGKMLKRTLKPSGERMFVTASEETIARTLDAWATLDERSMWNLIGPTLDWTDEHSWKLKAVTARDVFLAVAMELAFGLRRQEAAQAKWDWFKTFPGYPVLYGTANVKKGSGWLSVRALDPFYSTMMKRAEAEGWRGAPDDYVIDGTMTYRTDEVFRVSSAWLRALGWETKKTNHALRAYSGSQVIMKYGPPEARNWLRHEDLETTEASYSQYVRAFKPANLDDLPARWATLDPALPLRVLSAAA